jgi:hypothetical protein
MNNKADLVAYKDNFRCSSCGKYYRDNQWICKKCEECMKCCSCVTPELIKGKKLKQIIMEGESGGT